MSEREEEGGKGVGGNEGGRESDSEIVREIEEERKRERASVCFLLPCCRAMSLNVCSFVLAE